MELITQDAAEKYSSKLKKCSNLVIDNIDELLKERLEVGQSAVQDHFAEKITNPINQLSSLSCQKMDLIFRKSIENKRTNFKEFVDDVFGFLEEKAKEDSYIWESSGRTIQRLKHQILYNKQIEENLKEDIEKLTREYVDSVVETFKSYFFFNEEQLLAKRREKEQNRTKYSKGGMQSTFKAKGQRKTGEGEKPFESPKSTIKLGSAARSKTGTIQTSTKKSVISPLKVGSKHKKQPSNYSPSNFSLNQAAMMSVQSKGRDQESNEKLKHVLMSESSIKQPKMNAGNEIMVAQFDLAEIDDKENYFSNNQGILSSQIVDPLVPNLEEELKTLANITEQSPLNQKTSVLNILTPLEELDSPEIQLKSKETSKKPKEISPIPQNSQCSKRLTFSDINPKDIVTSFSSGWSPILQMFQGFELEMQSDIFNREDFEYRNNHDFALLEEKFLENLLNEGLYQKLSASYLALSSQSVCFPKVSALQLISLLKTTEILKEIDSKYIRKSVLTISGYTFNSSRRHATPFDANNSQVLDFGGFCRCLFEISIFTSKKSKPWLTSAI